MKEDKPKEILELERALGIDHVDYYYWDGEKVTKMKINNKGLKDISPLIKFQNLEELDLTDNQISDLAPLSKITSLKNLYLGVNKINNLTPISNTISLTTLELWGNQIKDISPLSSLVSLNDLDLRFNQISDISPISAITKLQYLALNGNQINNIESISGLKWLNVLRLSENLISDITPISELLDLNDLELFNNKIRDISPLTKLKALNKLILNNNQIIDIYPLTNLTALNILFLLGNQISDVLPLSFLDKIDYLDLRNNKIGDLSPLKKFIVEGFDILLNRANVTRYTSKREILIGENPLENPPISIVEEGSEAVLEYFNDIETYGEFEILEGKLLIVGEPRSGKTTLRKKLYDPRYKVPCDEDKETIGVSIQKGWSFSIDLGECKEYKANIWDFGGQERQYPLHQFFMDDVSCYVLVSDDRSDNSNMDKWFGMIKLLGGGHSNVLVILNQINRSTPSSNFNKERYEKQGFIVETFSIDFSNDSDQIYYLIEKIQHRIHCLPHMGQKLPKKICEPIRNEILRLKNNEHKNYLTIEEYFTACQKVDLKNLEEQNKALKYLRWIGDVVHFDNDHLTENIIILNPTWLTQAIYAIITCEELDEFHKKGIFNRQWFYDFMAKTTETKTTSYTNTECKHILNFMLKNNMDICYKSDDNIFIVPMCMPEKLPEYQFDENGGLVVLYQYESIPPGLISRLIVRMSEYIEDNLVAKNASIFIKNNARAKLDEYFKENDANQYLKIVVTGSHYDRYELMNEIKSTLKEIKRKSFKNLIYKEEIPCICSECKNNPKPFFHSMEKIRKKIDLSKKVIDCDFSGDDIAISELLGHTSNENFNILLDISKAIKELQKDSNLNAEFNMVFGDAFLEINDTILNIDGNTTKKPITSLEKIFEKGKRVKDWVSILKVPTDSIDAVDKLLNHIETYKELVS